MTVDPSTVVVAFIVAVLGPSLVAYLNGRQRHREKLEDYKRQDAVAEKLLTANAKVAGQLEENNQTTNAKLDTIHTLVNSDMTAALQAQLVALENSLYLMEKNAAWEVAQGDDPSEASHSVILATKHQIQELRSNLEDRVKAQADVDKR